MKTVKILCGGYGHAVNGVVKLITAGHSVEVADVEAQRLVALGMAAVDVATPTGVQEVSGAGVNASDDSNGSNEQETALFDEAKLLAMTNDELKKLGESMGADVVKCKKKAEYVAAILAAQEAAAESDEEDLPDLTAEDPV